MDSQTPNKIMAHFSDCENNYMGSASVTFHCGLPQGAMDIVYSGGIPDNIRKDFETLLKENFPGFSVCYASSPTDL